MNRTIAGLSIFLLAAFGIGAEVLTLQDALIKSLERGYQSRIDAADSTARQWQKRNVIAGYLPQVSYAARFMRYEQSMVDMTNFMYGGYPGTEDIMLRNNSLTHEFSVSQPISNGGTEIVAIRMAKHAKAAQDAGYAANRGNLIVQVQQAYFELVKAFEYRRIGEQDLEWAQRNHESARIKKESGIIPLTDFLRWEREVSEKKAALVQTDASIASQRAQLNMLMGIAPGADTMYNAENFESFEASFDTLTPAKGSIDGNAQLQSLKAYSALAHENVRMAIGSALPKLNAFAAWNNEVKWDEPVQTFGTGGSWTAGLTLSVPIFNGFRNSTAYKESQWDALKSDLTFQQAKSGLEANLIRIERFREASRINAVSAKQLWDLNQRNLAIMEDRYAVGQTGLLDFIDMQRAVAASRLGYVQKVLETLTLETEYRNATGKLEVMHEAGK